MYDSLYGLVTRLTPTRLTPRTVKTGTSIYQTRPTSATRNDRPAVFYDSTDSYPHQTPSCVSTTRPTLATLIEHLAAHIYDSTIPAIDITHLAEDQIQPPQTLHTRCNSDNKSSLLLYLLSRLCFPSLLLAVITRTH